MRLLGLAPDGVCLAADITADAGGLLHHLFTLTPLHMMQEAIRSLLHLPSPGFETGRPDVIRHAALWSSDFPLSQKG